MKVISSLNDIYFSDIREGKTVSTTSAYKNFSNTVPLCVILSCNREFILTYKRDLYNLGLYVVMMFKRKKKPLLIYWK